MCVCAGAIVVSIDRANRLTNENSSVVYLPGKKTKNTRYSDVYCVSLALSMQFEETGEVADHTCY